jgi:energy-converting hydrogenase A subunit M
MLLKCYYHLHPLVEFARGVVDQRVEEDLNLDIFDMIANTSEPTTKLVNRELLIFKRYQLDVKDIKCPM